MQDAAAKLTLPSKRIVARQAYSDDREEHDEQGEAGRIPEAGNPPPAKRQRTSDAASAGLAIAEQPVQEARQVAAATKEALGIQGQCSLRHDIRQTKHAFAALAAALTRSRTVMLKMGACPSRYVCTSKMIAGDQDNLPLHIVPPPCKHCNLSQCFSRLPMA